MAMVTGAVTGVVAGVVTEAASSVTGALLGAVPGATSAAGATHTLLLPAREVDPDFADRMPGLGAFIVFAFLAVALYFILRNMNARLRRMSYREKEREAQAAAAADSAEPSQESAGEAAAGPPVSADERDSEEPGGDERG